MHHLSAAPTALVRMHCLGVLILAACDVEHVAGSQFAGDAGPGETVDAGDGGCVPVCLKTQRCINGSCLDDPPPCGSPPHSACDSEFGIIECEHNGGEWTCSPINPDSCFCDCLANDFGCPCWKSSHCEGNCLDEASDPENCDQAAIGSCSRTRSGPVGCICRTIGDTYSGVCAD